MDFDVPEKLREIFECCEDKQFQRAVELQTEFEQHFIISSDVDVERLFSVEALELVFGFLKNKSNSTTLNLLSMLQLFQEETPKLSDFINDDFDTFSWGISCNIEEVEIRQFYAWCLLNLQPRGDTLQRLENQVFEMVLESPTRSNAKLVGEYVENVIQVVSLLPTFKLISDSLEFIEFNRLASYPFGMSELIPKILKLCENNDEFVAREFETEVVHQVSDIIEGLRLLKHLHQFNHMYMIQQITYFAFIDQNIQIFKMLEERQFYEKLLALAEQDIPHVISFTREIVHFYMELFEKLCFIPKDIEIGIDQVNEILFLDKTNEIMHEVVEKMPDETAYLTYIEYNGFVPIKVRTNYIAMLIICLKEFYVDLNSLEWKYTSLFTKPSPEESRQLVQLNVDLPLYNMLGQFLRYFLLASKPALKLYSNSNFKHENYGKFLLDNVFSSSYSVASDAQNDANEASDKYVENTWATLDEIGIRPLRPRKKKEVAKLSKYIGDIPVIHQPFNFSTPITLEASDVITDDGEVKQNRLRSETSYKQTQRETKGLSIKLSELSDSDMDQASPKLLTLGSDSDDDQPRKLSVNICRTPKSRRDKLSTHVRNSSSSEESQMQEFRFCGVRANSSDDDSDCNVKLTISIGESHADKSGTETGPPSSRSAFHSSEGELDSAQRHQQIEDLCNAHGPIVNSFSDVLHVNEAVSVDVSMDCDHGDANCFEQGFCVSALSPRPFVLKLGNASNSDDDSPIFKNPVNLRDDVLDLSLKKFSAEEDFALQKSDST